MNQADKDAVFLYDWLKSQVQWAREAAHLSSADQMNRRYLAALSVMTEAEWRLFVVAALMRRMPMFPALPPVEQEAA